MSPPTPPGELPRLRLEDLASTFPHIPAECGGSLAQASALCLEGERHASGVSLAVDGVFAATVRIDWTMDVTEAMRRYWADLEETTEQGAYGIALLLMRALTGLTVVERARKGTGFDWWLGSDDPLFQAKARLEVSGIREGTLRVINSRVKARAKQTERSDVSGLAAYVVVVEFGTPRVRVIRR